MLQVMQAALFVCPVFLLIQLAVLQRDSFCDMPLLVLSGAEKTAALEAADADLKFHLSSAKVAEDVQCALFHKGFITLPIFAGMDESRSEVRIALEQEIGLKHDADTKSRQAVALILSAWEAARIQWSSSTHSPTI